MQGIGMTEYRAPIRFSGLRISLLPTPEQQRDEWIARLNDVQWLLPALQQALAEPFFADDYIVDMPFDEVVKSSMQGGELFGCVHDEKVVGFVLLRNIKPGRDAWIEAYTAPEFRGKYPCSRQIRQILDYAFRPWNPETTRSQQLFPRGLGLQKIKAAVSAANTSAHAALWRLGFNVIGRSPADGLFKGKYTDIILVEKINPALLPQEGMQDVWKRRRKQGSGTNTPELRGASSVHASAPVHLATGLDGDVPERGSASGEQRTGGGQRSRKRNIAGLEQLRVGVVEPEGQPDGRAKRSEGGKHVPTGSGATVRARRVKPQRKRTGRE